jgi:hypothetical protein
MSTFLLAQTSRGPIVGAAFGEPLVLRLRGGRLQPPTRGT